MQTAKYFYAKQVQNCKKKLEHFILIYNKMENIFFLSNAGREVKQKSLRKQAENHWCSVIGDKIMHDWLI